MNLRDLTFSNFDWVAPYYIIRYYKPIGATRISRFSKDTFNRNDRDTKELFCYGFTWPEYIGALNALEVLDRKNA